jgi:glutathione S-transferase
MKFYDCQTAPSPRRVRMFIAEKGVVVPSVEVNLREKEQLGEAFLKVNPNATVPALVLDDGTVLKTTAGCRAFLDAQFPQPALLGRTNAERGRVADLIWQIEADGFMAVAECLRNTAKGMKDRALPGPHNYAQNPALGERGRLRAERFFPVLNELIGEQPFLAGDALTAADIDAFIFVEFSSWLKLSFPNDCEDLQRWHSAMKARPSAAL